MKGRASSSMAQALPDRHATIAAGQNTGVIACS
jgi:hypothetical protein